MADSPRIYDTLKSALEERQARAVTLAIQQSASDLGQDIKTVVSKDELRTALAETKAELMGWMFVFWIGQVAVTVGTVLTAFRMLK